MRALYGFSCSAFALYDSSVSGPEGQGLRVLDLRFRDLYA